MCSDTIRITVTGFAYSGCYELRPAAPEHLPKVGVARSSPVVHYRTSPLDLPKARETRLSPSDALPSSTSHPRARPFVA